MQSGRGLVRAFGRLQLQAPFAFSASSYTLPLSGGCAAPFGTTPSFPAAAPSPPRSRSKAVPVPVVETTDTTSLPKNILLLRHGRSLGNEDETLFGRLSDWKIPLSEEGRKQARQAGVKIQRVAGTDPLLFYVSPYLRTKQTFEELSAAITSDVLLVREEPRLREQDFGNFQRDPEKMLEAKRDRVDFGRFFYRFPDGESGADVFDRVSAFCGTFGADMEQIGASLGGASTAVFVTHGITARLFVMRYLHWTVEDFEALHNLPNCGLIHLRRFDEPGGPAYRLTGESRELIKAPKDPGLGKALRVGRRALRGKFGVGVDGGSVDGDEGEGWDFSETAWGL